MAEKWYVLRDNQDPGSSHDTYEEAREECVKLQKSGWPHARIFGPDLWNVPSNEGFYHTYDEDFTY